MCTANAKCCTAYEPFQTLTEGKWYPVDSVTGAIFTTNFNMTNGDRIQTTYKDGSDYWMLHDLIGSQIELCRFGNNLFINMI